MTANSNLLAVLTSPKQRFRVAQSSVFTTGRKKHKIFGAVVEFVMIHVVDNFFPFKQPPESRFHYKAMFKDVTGFCCVWMVRVVEIFIPIINKVSAMPLRVFMPCSCFSMATIRTITLAWIQCPKWLPAQYATLIDLCSSRHGLIIDVGRS